MNAIDGFLKLNPNERIESILKAKRDFPADPYPGLRCISLDPSVEFVQLEESVLEEIRTFTRLLVDLDHIKPDDVNSWVENAEKYVLALSVMRVKV